MRESGNWHPALDALFYSDVSAPESGYCLGDSSGYGACIADHRPRAMIFKWAVVVLMGSYFPKANSSQLWLNRIVWKTFKNMLMPEFHAKQFRFSWSGVLSRLWNFQNVLRSMKCTAELRTTVLDDCIRILGKTSVRVILKNNFLNYSSWDTIFNLFTISSNLKWGCEGFFFFFVLKGAIVRKAETQA